MTVLIECRSKVDFPVKQFILTNLMGSVLFSSSACKLCNYSKAQHLFFIDANFKSKLCTV